jgi:hypothetical protein
MSLRNTNVQSKAKVKVTLRPRPVNQYRSPSYFTTDSQSVSQSVSMSCCRAHSGTSDQISLPVGMLLSEICGLVSVGRPLCREDGSAICCVITQWSESLRTRNHISVSSETLPTWRTRFPYLYPPETGWPSYTHGHWVI